MRGVSTPRSGRARKIGSHGKPRHRTPMMKCLCPVCPRACDKRVSKNCDTGICDYCTTGIHRDGLGD